jgi:hypothetical protein
MRSWPPCEIGVTRFSTDALMAAFDIAGLARALLWLIAP